MRRTQVWNALNDLYQTFFLTPEEVRKVESAKVKRFGGGSMVDQGPKFYQNNVRRFCYNFDN